MIKNLFVLPILILILTSCGFKVVDKSKFNDFSIQNIDTAGDNRTNFKLKNYLLNTDNENSENTLVINLNTKKVKSVKEKNLKNEITKYQININTKVEVENRLRNLRFSSNISVSGDYLVGDNYSTTINNEKKLINDLVETLSKKILDNINLKLNDL